MSLRKSFLTVLHELEKGFESRALRSSDPTDPLSRLVIIPYRSFGTAGSLHVSGRVLRVPLISDTGEGDSVWRNVLASYRRFDTVEVAGVEVEARFGDLSERAQTDEEGYFRMQLIPLIALPAVHWFEVELELSGRSADRVMARTEVLVPMAEAEMGVISDIDDTVVQTGATDLVKMVKTVVLQSARSRLAFPGVAQFYRELESGNTAGAKNPVFYVSSGPWNLYELLAEFFRLQEIPPGPIMLQDYGIEESKLIHSAHDDHKLEQIERVLSTYPKLPFLLIGDSGQRDPEIYEKVVADFPGRITSVYLRDVTVQKRDAGVQGIAERITNAGVEVIFADSTMDFARHAASRGYISPDALARVEADFSRKQGEP